MFIPALRQNQLTDLSCDQVDGNFIALATLVNANTPWSLGTTPNRPNPPVLGQPFIDTTLGLPIICIQVTPTIWIDFAGVQV